jgi:YjbE family integral membrane protein
MMEAFLGPDTGSALSALFQVLMIDLVLAGDNAVAVGLAAAGLPVEQRRKVILYGLGAAVALRIGFALITTQLLNVVGLLVAGGALLLYVCWRMWRELRAQAAEARAEAALEDATGVDVDGQPGVRAAAPGAPRKTFKEAFTQVFLADVSMSLDNVLAVAGAAREHPTILIFGLLVSIVLMGVAATFIARLLHKYRWIGYIGLVIVLYVALHMMWDGYRSAVVKLDYVERHNAAAPAFLDVGPAEVEKYAGKGDGDAVEAEAAH